MKRLFFMLMMISALGLALGACNKKEGEKKDDKKEEAAKGADDKKEEATDEAAEGGDEAAEGGDEAAEGGEEGGDEAAEGGEGGEVEGSLGVEECDKYWKRLVECDKLPAQAKDGLKMSFDAWVKSKEQAEKAGALDQWKDATKKACEQAASGWEQTLKAQGC